MVAIEIVEIASVSSLHDRTRAEPEWITPICGAIDLMLVCNHVHRWDLQAPCVKSAAFQFRSRSRLSKRGLRVV